MDAVCMFDECPTIRPFPHHHLSCANTCNHSSNEEKLKLIDQIESLTLRNQGLEQQKLNLQGTIFDLRKLLVLIGRESFQQSQYLRKANEKLASQVQSLQRGLKHSYKNGDHLAKCALFWSQFLQ